MIFHLKITLLPNFYAFLMNLLNTCIIFYCNVMQCELCIYLAPYEYYTHHRGPLWFCRMGQRYYFSRHRRDFCAFLLEKRDPHGVPSSFGHSCMACATVRLPVTPSFSVVTDVSTLRLRFKTDIRRNPVISRLTVRTRHYRSRIKPR